MTNVQAAIARLTPTQRAVRAKAFSEGKDPLFAALVRDLLAANAREEADFAELQLAARLDHAAEMDAIAANLPPVPAPTEQNGITA